MKISFTFLITTLFFSQWLNAEFMIAKFESRISYYLDITSLETIFVDDNMDCSFACVKNALCVSFNLAVLADDKGNHRCDLLPTTSYNNEGKFFVDHHFHHFTMKVT